MRLAISLLASALVFAQTDAWDTHHQAARKALNQKRYDVAAKEADAGFKEVENAGPSDPRYIRSLMDRAAVESQDNLGTAERTLRFALDGAERAGTFAKDTALSSDLRKELIARLDDLASRPGPSNPAETQVYLRAALVQAGKLDPPDTRLMRVQLNSLGVSLINDGYYKLAETTLRRALALEEDALPLSNLANAYIQMGRNAEAQAALDRAISLDASAAATAASTSSVGFPRSMRLAALNNQTGQYDVAEAVLKQALQAYKGPQFEEPIQVALGNADCGRGRFDSALDHFRQALEINKQRMRTEDNLNRGEMISEMGACAARKGDLPGAADYFTEAKAILEKTVRAGHPALALLEWRQALVWEAQKKPADAEPMLAHAIAALEAAEGADSPVLAKAWDDSARMRKSMTKPASAQEALARAEAIRVRWRGAASPSPAALSVPDLAETAYWESLAAHEAPPLYRQYLRDYPKGQFANIARSRSADQPGGGAPCQDNFYNLSSADLRGCVDYWTDAGFFPAALAAYTEGQNTFFAGSFQKGLPRTVTPLLTFDEFERDLKEYGGRGQTPATITQTDDAQNPRFTVTWMKRESASFTSGLVNEACLADITAKQSQGMVNTLLFIYGAPTLKYAAVWEPSSAGSETRSLVDQTPEQLADAFLRMPKQGFRPYRCLPYTAAAGRKWVEIWIKTPGYTPGWTSFRNHTKPQYLATRDDMLSRGFRLQDLTAAGARFTSVWMKP